MDYKFKDTKFMSAEEKEKVLKDWEQFIRSDFKEICFTKRLYDHLHLHCSFIAHYDRLGFYAHYFSRPEMTIQFFRQFDRDCGCRSAEYGDVVYWLHGEYSDINTAMCDVWDKYKTKHYARLKKAIRDRGLDLARSLYEKHGVMAPW